MSAGRFDLPMTADCVAWKQRVHLENRAAQSLADGVLLYRGHGPFAFRGTDPNGSVRMPLGGSGKHHNDDITVISAAKHRLLTAAYANQSPGAASRVSPLAASPALTAQSGQGSKSRHRGVTFGSATCDARPSTVRPRYAARGACDPAALPALSRPQSSRSRSSLGSSVANPSRTTVTAAGRSPLTRSRPGTSGQLRAASSSSSGRARSSFSEGLRQRVAAAEVMANDSASDTKVLRAEIQNIMTLVKAL